MAREIRALGPDVSAEEASRAAQIAYTYSLQLKKEYNVTDPPIIHNAKVINGFRERGLLQPLGRRPQEAAGPGTVPHAGGASRHRAPGRVPRHSSHRGHQPARG
ncbi:hypothetical protein ACFOHS_15610 [Jhaorihella thermophila]